MKKQDVQKIAIGRRLSACIQASGVRQMDVSRAYNIPANTLNMWVKGRNMPDVRQLSRLCSAYGWSLDYIFLGNPDGLKHDFAQRVLLIAASLGEPDAG